MGQLGVEELGLDLEGADLLLVVAEGVVDGAIEISARLVGRRFDDGSK